MVIVVATMMFMVQLDVSVLVIALPQIARHFGVPVVSLSLAVSIYLIMLVAFLPLSGWAADRFGARRVLIAATGAFGLFSLLCAFTGAVWQFILLRALMGMAASLLTPVARLVLLKQARREELVDALSITAMPMLVAPTIGPSLGGFIVEHGSWQYIFLLNVPVALALMGLTRLRIEAFPPARGHRLDWLGAALLAGALIALLTGIDRLAAGLTRPGPWALLAAGALLAALTGRHLRRHAAPIVTLDALADPAFRTTVIGAGAVVRLPLRAMLFLLPLMFQDGLGFSPFLAGLMLIALNGGDLLTKPVLGHWFDRYGFRRTSLVGCALILAALAALLPVDGGPVGVVVILLALVAAGIARSIVFTGMASLTFAALDKAQMSSGNVVANISMQMFNALAVSLTALLLGVATALGGRAAPALADYRLTLGAITLIGLVSALLLVRQLPVHLRDLDGGRDRIERA